MDAYTEEIKGYNIGDSLDTRNSIFALEMHCRIWRVSMKEPII